MTFAEPQTVVIAGRPRQGIVWCYPGIEGVYEWADRVHDETERRRRERMEVTS
jgi:hypothetical protein